MHRRSLHSEEKQDTDPLNPRLIFVAMTNILLISSLISLMSLSLEGVSGGLTPNTILAQPINCLSILYPLDLGNGTRSGRVFVPVCDPQFGCMVKRFMADVVIPRLSIYVLESSNSRKLTYFMPPLVSD